MSIRESRYIKWDSKIMGYTSRPTVQYCIYFPSPKIDKMTDQILNSEDVPLSPAQPMHAACYETLTKCDVVPPSTTLANITLFNIVHWLLHISP